MIFVVSPKTKQLIGIAVGMVGVLVAYLAFSSSYRNERLQIWLHPESHEKGLQTMQALYAIGSGGIFGKGLGQSMQKMGFIPESHNDMIFSIICEELGLSDPGVYGADLENSSDRHECGGSVWLSDCDRIYDTYCGAGIY